jgi:AraC-like DNA-binding protein
MVDISTWEDLSGGQQLYTVYDLFLLFSVFQGILLIITIPTIHEYNREANRWLILLIGFTSTILLIKVVSNYPSLAHSLPKLQIVPDFILFIYAPLFYYYIQKLLFQSQTKTKLIYFIPVVVQFFLYTAYFLTDPNEFQAKLLNPNSELKMMASLALAINIYYWILSKRSIDYYKLNFRNSNSYEQNLQYLGTVLFIQAACLLGWVATFVLAGLGKLLSLDITASIEISIETIWIVFSMITFFLGYFVIHEPDIFRLPQTAAILEGFNNSITQQIDVEIDEDNPIEKEEAEIENLEEEMEKVSTFMEKHKPYTNPKLTLVDLASRLKMQPHSLSKIINAGFGKNFFDFINTYRIEEFKRRVEDPHYKNYTLLGIAFDVGFNSKTAFNRSFKKITNQTPSSFFNTIKEF